MLTNRSHVHLMGLAVTAGLIACSGGTHTQAVTVSASAAAQAKAVGERLAAEDRANTERHREAIARLMRVDGVRVSEADRTMTIRFTVHNLSAKRVNRIEAGFEVDDSRGGRIGGTELHDNLTLAPRTSRSVALTIPYTQFGSGTGAVREAVGKQQRHRFDVTEIKYADGSDAGYDD